MSTTAKRHRRSGKETTPWIVDLFEHVQFEREAVDRDAGIIRDVKVLGNTSKNGHTYSNRAKEDACRVLEGAKVNFDHNRHKTPELSERKFIESIGNLRGLYVKPDGVYAKEFHVKKSHPNAELLFESAERFPNDFGLSIDAQGRLNEKTHMVESIVGARSVDIVGNPATTKGLFESTNHKAKRMVKTSIKQIVESMSDPKIKARCVKLMEDGPSAAMLGSPLQMDDPGVGADGQPTETDPMDDLDDAFCALVEAIIRNTGLDVSAKLKQIGILLKSQDALINGDSPDPATTSPVKEDDSNPDDEDDPMKESVAKEMNTKLDKLMESFVANETLTKRNAISIRLIAKNIEPLPERIDQCVAAKDEAAITTLMESFPPKIAAVTRPKPTLLQPQNDETLTYPSDAKGFASLLK